MQNNYYFLKKLVPELSDRIVGLKLVEAFSQDKDELVICFAAARGKRSHYKEFYVKAAVFPRFSCLYFSNSFKRAKKNSASLLEVAYDQVVTDVRLYENERCFSIVLSGGFTLLFKLFGQRSNIVLFQDGTPDFLFNNHLKEDWNLRLDSLDRPIDQSYDAFVAADGNIKTVFPTFGKLVNAYIDNALPNAPSIDQKWAEVNRVLALLDANYYAIIQYQGDWYLSLLAMGEVQEIYHDPIEASNAFFVWYNRIAAFEQEKAALNRNLQKEKKRNAQYIDAAYERLQALEAGLTNEKKGHLLMAHLHEVPEYQSSVRLPNFYDNTEAEIKLKPEWSPQKNAENYYRKAKNEKIEQNKIIENIELREAQQQRNEERLTELDSITDLKSLRAFVKTLPQNLQSQETTASEPFKRFQYDGFDIWVGKNAKSNDALTFKYGYKEDLWMHARDTPGSHVLLKYRAGKAFPENVVEYAAGVAAFYSKRKTEQLVPVIVTPKKFVRKPKGLPPGQVLVEKETVVMVEPVNPTD